MKQKNKGGFLGMLLGTLGASLLGNMLSAKDFVQTGDGATSPKGGGTIRAGEGATSTSQRKKTEFLVPSDLWIILKHKHITRMNKKLTVFIQETTCLKKRLGKCDDSQWVQINDNLLYSFVCESNCLHNSKLNTVTYFDNLRVGHILDNIKKFIVNKNTTTNSYRIKSNDSIICG